MSDSLGPGGLYRPWNSPGQNTGVGSLSFLQGIFPTQGSNPGLPHCRRILYQLSHEGSPIPPERASSLFKAALLGCEHAGPDAGWHPAGRDVPRKQIQLQAQIVGTSQRGGMEPVRRPAAWFSPLGWPSLHLFCQVLSCEYLFKSGK